MVSKTARPSVYPKLRWSAADLKGRDVVNAPYRHATYAGCLPPLTGAAVLDWLESEAPWTLKRTDFYEQYEFSCWDSPSDVANFLTSNSVLRVVRTEMEEVFNRTFETNIGVVCHKLLAGQRIGIHNDYLAGEETHRLIVQLNREMSDRDGGFLMLFGSGDAADVRGVLRPRHLSGFAFEISGSSFHAVSQIHSGSRYTLIFSLRAETS
jgi:hypothetical protein